MDAVTKKTGKHNAASSNLQGVTIIAPADRLFAEPAYTDELLNKVKSEMALTFSKDETADVLDKLKTAFAQINKNSAKKSVVVYIGAGHQNILAIDMVLDEQIFIDRPFEIRDLIHNMHPASKYIMLVQSAKVFRLFLGTPGQLLKIKTSIPTDIAAYDNDIPEKIEYFSDVTDRKEVLLDKFILHIDKELDRVLNQYKLPVFVLGTERMNGHFKKHTHHTKSILDYVHGNYDDTPEHELIAVVKPYLAEMANIERKEVALQIEQAQNANKFCFGMEDVWQYANQKMGQTLFVENDFHCPQPGTTGDTLPASSFIRDGVDLIIEKVLENGGSVQFADAAALNGYQHIALCLYY